MLSEENDETLLQMMADTSASSEATSAWEEFYMRHRAYLYAVLLRAHRLEIGEPRLVEIVQDTFIRARERASTYRADAPRTRSDTPRHRVRAWLGTIAENILRDSFRREPQVIFMDEAEIEARHDRPGDGDEHPSPTLDRLTRALSRLSAREQEVLRVTGFWYQPGQKQQRLPNAVMRRLTADLQTTAENVRQIRARALKALRAAMDTNDNE